MTPLAQIIAARIARTGPISVADYMMECLLHPEHGYYTTRDPLGAEGDFITAPEISQMFGELIGLWLAQVWLDQGAPSPFILAELGPGRGTLMADALRATRAVPGFHAALSLHLVEASPTLREVQKKALAGWPVTFHDHIGALPDGPLFLIANEFFDALPIRQFLRTGDGWHERQIGEKDGTLIWGLAPAAPQPDLAHRMANTREGDMVETCPAALPIAHEIGQRITERGGAALIVDYGEWESLGDSFQAIRGHKVADVLALPGQSDLTAHVSFAEIVRAAGPARASALTPQGVFLERLGITDRARHLAENLSGKALEAHIAAHRRLTHPAEMGTLFKALALTPPGSPEPPGLDQR